jgi:hypothetical protein
MHTQAKEPDREGSAHDNACGLTENGIVSTRCDTVPVNTAWPHQQTAAVSAASLRSLCLHHMPARQTHAASSAAPEATLALHTERAGQEHNDRLGTELRNTLREDNWRT